MPEDTLLGKSVPRVDTLAKATGEAKYTADLKLPRMLHASATFGWSSETTRTAAIASGSRRSAKRVSARR